MNAGTKLETEEWSMGFDSATVTEILLAKGTSAGFERWVYADYTEIVPSARTAGSWTDPLPVLKTQTLASSGTVSYYTTGSRQTIPWVYSGNTDANMVFIENNGADEGIVGTQKPDSFDDGKSFYVLVR